jgi:rubrerythrin
MSPHTRKNQLEALHRGALAIVKYTLFARRARRNGREALAALFEGAARVDRLEHFAEEAGLAEVVGSDADNLRDAIKGENHESTTMYPQVAKQAAAAGDKAAADRFEEIGRDEAKHRDAFQNALDDLEQHGTDKGIGGSSREGR